MTFDFDAELQAALGPGYEIERELTGSGMSRVFVATERELNRRVVIKVLPPELAAGVNRERFRREIQLAAQLQHPHIVPLHAAGARGDLLYFTMPFIEGESLRHALVEGQRFSAREVVRILHNVADALAYAHARGVIHRDIKPGNVLRSGSHALVTDFGVAKAISAALPAVGMTTSGMAIGTPQYMAPEQLAGDPAADHRVDIYALGLLAYELLAGEAPFKAPSPQETMAAQLTRIPEPITRRRADTPPVLAALIARCLAKSPAERPQSAGEVSAALDEIDVSSGSAAPLRAPRRRSAAAMGAVAVALLAAGILWVQGRASRQVSASGPQRPETTSVAGPAPAVLTREDSLAIAAAIERKFAEQRAAARVRAESTQRSNRPAAANAPAMTQEDLNRQMTRIADSLRVEIQRSVLDSVTRVRGRPLDISAALGAAMAMESLGRAAQGAARPFPSPDERRLQRARELSSEAFAERANDLGPPRRLLLSHPRLSARQGALASAADSLADSLRMAIQRTGRFVVIDQDSTRRMLERTRTINTIAEAMNVEVFASIYLTQQKDSAISWTITVRDLTAHPAFTTRSIATRSDPGAPLSSIEGLVSKSVQFLHEIDRAPRRPTPPAPPSR